MIMSEKFLMILTVSCCACTINDKNEYRNPFIGVIKLDIVSL